MKSFKNFLTEEVEPAAFVEKGKTDCSDHAVRDNINILLNSAMSCSHITPYMALQKVSKILAMFHITLPKTNFLEGPHGFETFRLQQFGNTIGMRNDGSVVTKIEEPYTLYFEWMQNERGMFKVFCEIVDDSELSSLLDNAEKEVNDEDPAEDRDEKIYEWFKGRKSGRGTVDNPYPKMSERNSGPAGEPDVEAVNQLNNRQIKTSISGQKNSPKTNPSDPLSGKSSKGRLERIKASGPKGIIPEENIYEGIVTKAIQGLKKRQAANAKANELKAKAESIPTVNGAKTREAQKLERRSLEVGRMGSGKIPFSHLEEEGGVTNAKLTSTGSDGSVSVRSHEKTGSDTTGTTKTTSLDQQGPKDYSYRDSKETRTKYSDVGGQGPGQGRDTKSYSDERTSSSDKDSSYDSRTRVNQNINTTKLASGPEEVSSKTTTRKDSETASSSKTVNEAKKPFVVKAKELARELVGKLKGEKQEPKKETTQGELLSREAARKRALYKPGLEEDAIGDIIKATKAPKQDMKTYTPGEGSDSGPARKVPGYNTGPRDSKAPDTSKTVAPSDSGGESMAVSIQKKGESQSKTGFLKEATRLEIARQAAKNAYQKSHKDAKAAFDKEKAEKKKLEEETLDEERKRTRKVADAFMNHQKARERTLTTDGNKVEYHNNVIAKHEGDEVHVTTAGYGQSPSTRGHINGILDRLDSPRLHVKKGQLYHGDNPVGSKDWIKVKNTRSKKLDEALNKAADFLKKKIVI